MKQQHIYVQIQMPAELPNAQRKYTHRTYFQFDTREDAVRWIEQNIEEFPPDEVNIVLHDFLPINVDQFLTFKKKQDDAKIIEEITQEMEIWNLRQSKKQED